MNRTSSRSHAICFITVECATDRADDSDADEDEEDEYDHVEEGDDDEPEDGGAASTSTTARAGRDKGPGRGAGAAKVKGKGKGVGKAKAKGKGVAKGTGAKKETHKEIKVRGKITLCDLAGSERVKKTGNDSGACCGCVLWLRAGRAVVRAGRAVVCGLVCAVKSAR
jgi:hypothetical protein